MTRDKKVKIQEPIVPPSPIEKVIASIGSVYSLALHTAVFLCFFMLSVFQVVTWELMLLVLTTIVSLEAIYLAIFIQITVNRHTESLKEVEDNLDEIQEDVEELSEDVEDIQEDIEEISEDIEGISEDIDEIQEDVEELNEEDEEDVPAGNVRKTETANKATRDDLLEQMSKDITRLLADLEALKKSK